MPSEVFGAALISFVGGGALVTLIGFLDSRFKFREERKAKREDRELEKADKTEELHQKVHHLQEADARQDAEYGERLDRLERQMEAVARANKLMMLDRILHIGLSYIEKGEITIDERRRLHEMHDCYHEPIPNGLGGNGDANLIMAAVDELPLKK